MVKITNRTITVPIQLELQTSTLPFPSTIPVRNKSAFLHFSADMRKKFKESGTQEVNPNELLVNIAAMWKALAPQEKTVYEAAAEKDKQRYQRELKAFEDSYGGKVRINKTKSNHVKRPCTPFACFMKEHGKAYRAKYSSMRMTEVIKIISVEWKNLDKNVKKVYEDMSKAQRVQFTALQKIWKPQEDDVKKVNKKGNYVGNHSEEDCVETINKKIKPSKETEIEPFSFMDLSPTPSFETVDTPNLNDPAMTQLLASIDFSVFSTGDQYFELESDDNKKENLVLETATEIRNLDDPIADWISYDSNEFYKNYLNTYQILDHINNSGAFI